MMAQAPADTFNFMLLGYGVILGAIGLYLLSLVARFRTLGRDLVMLAELEAGGKD
jgi:hypothetical protein